MKIKNKDKKHFKNKIKLKKVKNATGYKIQYSLNKKFKKKVRTIKTKKTTYKIKKLKREKPTIYAIKRTEIAQKDRLVQTGQRQKK